MRTNAIELRAADVRVVIDPDRGGRLASWSIGEQELLVGPPTADDRSIRWGCYLMAPWPGRLENGRFEWAGRTIQLPRTHGRHAIHGLVWDRPWEVASASAGAASLAVDLGAAGWPFRSHVRHAIRLERDRLELVATIHADERMPAAVGWHPWFVGGEALRLRVAADAVVVTREMLPTGGMEAVTGPTDLRAGPLLGRRRLDHAYVAADSPVDLHRPGLRLRIAFEPTPTTVVVHTPPDRICVEPQTAWPNALASPPDAGTPGAGAHILEAGEELEATMTLSWDHGDRPKR